jgi:hypothetical protein
VGDFDQVALQNGVDLVGRCGARMLEFGYLHEDVPVAEAGWWAQARYCGVRVTTEHHVGPVEAVEALAVKLLEGGCCNHCKGRVTLGAGDPPMMQPGHLIDGTRWHAVDQAAAGVCRWTREPSAGWMPSCTEGREAIANRPPSPRPTRG